jgi:hypothetical protein
MIKSLISSVALCNLAQASIAESNNPSRTLVLLDSYATIETHSLFFRHLEDKLGHHLDYEMADSKVNFKQFDQWRYENVVLMAPSIKGKSPKD